MGRLASKIDSLMHNIWGMLTKISMTTASGTMPQRSLAQEAYQTQVCGEEAQANIHQYTLPNKV